MAEYGIIFILFCESWCTCYAIDYGPPLGGYLSTYKFSI